jgi:hypothetical protein
VRASSTATREHTATLAAAHALPGDAAGLFALQCLVDRVSAWAVDLNLVKHVKLKAKLAPRPVPLVLGGAGCLPPNCRDGGSERHQRGK